MKETLTPAEKNLVALQTGLLPFPALSDKELEYCKAQRLDPYQWAATWARMYPGKPRTLPVRR